MTHPGAGLRAVIFDLDGTLIDTADDFIPAVQQLAEDYGRSRLDPQQIRCNVSNGSRALVTLALDLSPDDDGFDDARQRLLNLYGQVLGQHARPYPGIASLLERLSAQNIAWGIATNKPRAYTVPLLETLALRAGSVVCPDDVDQPKPHPESLHRACRELDCQTSEAIYVGDHQRDIEAGRRAAMFTIAAAYGYIEADDSAHHWGADGIASTSTQLDQLLFPGCNA